MDLNVAVLVGRVVDAPRFLQRNGRPEATIRLACQRPTRRPAAVDLVDVAVDAALAADMADSLVEGCRIVAGGRLERRAPRGGAPTLHLVATMMQILEPGGRPSNQPAR